ncbi:hypothetical protein A3C87_02850 [Candidatus Kaiserbacteria bacterium RIFCSPHIGHO2_02_FULL_49_34]|uniref:Uncharacterized protein n=1 Tax=Candidatus Kaiserbacteria bacterium RIFCSPHIGHO2_02_FULL_49_34 TaxID=1798491 RepID=A0A1F6DJS2_9BACT|nr:MAG: hypothetical protein A3C87_02850 [Candidatus Kaiserbacteria bacterium RIFCSPHIGHO2_02_FULL_49_34]
MKKQTKPSRFRRILGDIVIFGAVLFLVAVGSIFVWVATLDIPDLSAFNQRLVAQSTKIYDRTGETILYDTNSDVRRTVVRYEEISDNIKNGTIAIEDAEFWTHAGVRPTAIIRSMFTSLSQGKGVFSGGGGSTITQQVIKNSVLQQERSLTRKIKEAILSIRLEQVMEKDEILLTYLNESPYGGTIYGVEEASQAFFGKHAYEVTLAEAAYLASLPQAPTRLSPYSQEFRDPETRPETQLEKRKNYVLTRMVEEGMISQEDAERAQDEEVVWKPYVSAKIRAPHYVMYVLEQLETQFGDEVLNKGYKIITAVDLKLQEKAEEIVKEYALKNDAAYNAANAALVAQDPKNGDVLVLIGSRDFFEEDTTDARLGPQYNVATKETPGRQPGSAFKPFIYATAFEKGYTPDSILFDVETQFSTACAVDNFKTNIEDANCYSPKNYDNTFRGPVSIRNALAQSLNVPAVKMFYLAGRKSSVKTARDMGITTLPDTTPSLDLVLGSGEVTLSQMVGAYAVFATEGERVAQRTILSIEDTRGKKIMEFEEQHLGRVLERNTALNISNILSDNTARTPLFGANSPLYFEGRDVAAKTGTTNNKKDVWVIGYAPNLVAGAWAGNNNNKEMKELSGLIITPLWRAFMDEALKDLPIETFPEPTHTTTGKPILDGMWLGMNEGGEPEIHSELYFIDTENPTGNNPSNPNSDPQFKYWEYGVLNWLQSLLGNNTGSFPGFGLPTVATTTTEVID